MKKSNYRFHLYASVDDMTGQRAHRTRKTNMNPVRIIYDDTPDCIPIPETLRHRKTEIILWPLDDQAVPASVTLRPNSRHRRPGAWSHLPPAAADWDSPEVNREIARSLFDSDD